TRTLLHLVRRGSRIRACSGVALESPFHDSSRVAPRPEHFPSCHASLPKPVEIGNCSAGLCTSSSSPVCRRSSLLYEIPGQTRRSRWPFARLGWAEPRYRTPNVVVARWLLPSLARHTHRRRRLTSDVRYLIFEQCLVN